MKQQTIVYTNRNVTECNKGQAGPLVTSYNKEVNKGNLMTRTYLVRTDSFDELELTSDQIRQAVDMLGLTGEYELMADFFTNLNCGSYADLADKTLEYYDDVDEAMEDSHLRLAETWHRILNIDIDDKTCYTAWYESNITTKNG